MSLDNAPVLPSARCTVSLNEALAAIGDARGRSTDVLMHALARELQRRGVGLPYAQLHQLAEAIASGRPLSFRP